MRLCSLLLVSFLSTQTPAIGGFGPPNPSEIVTVNLPVTIDQATLDGCKFFKDNLDHDQVFVCTIKNAAPIDRPLLDMKKFTFGVTAPLPSTNRFKDIAEATMKVVATNEELRITLQAVLDAEHRGYLIPVGFESVGEAREAARQIMARQPNGRREGSVVIQYAK